MMCQKKSFLGSTSDKRAYKMVEDVEVEREIDLKILGQPKTKHRRREREYEI